MGFDIAAEHLQDLQEGEIRVSDASIRVAFPRDRCQITVLCQGLPDELMCQHRFPAASLAGHKGDQTFTGERSLK